MPVIDTDNGQMDVISRLLKDRILLLGQGVDDEVANVLVAQLLYLANEDPTKDITLYINSPGGSVSAGMAIYDTMQYVPCKLMVSVSLFLLLVRMECVYAYIHLAHTVPLFRTFSQATCRRFALEWLLVWAPFSWAPVPRASDGPCPTVAS
jgi:hypothetical protein